MKLDTKDIIKLLGFVFVTCSMWYDLKQDLAVTKATVEIRLSRLEKDNNPIASVTTYQRMALVPSETKVEGE